VVPDAQRGDLVGALRWEEAQPDCFRPLCVVEEPFEDAGSYFSAVSRRVLETYEGLRGAAREAGIELPDVKEAASPLPVVAAVKTALDAAAALPASLAGLSVLLAPARLQDEAAWAAQVDAVSKTVKTLSRAGAKRDDSGGTRDVRWIVHDRPGGPLQRALGEGVELSLDEGALFDFWKGMLARPAQAAESSQSGAAAPSGTLAAPDAVALRAHVATAAEHLRAGDPRRGAESFRAAAALCAHAGLLVEEAGMRMAVAGGELAVPAPAQAVVEYRRAAEAAESGGAATLACQAKLGEGAAELSQKRRAEAAAAYERAAELAQEAGAAALHVEALRMAGACRLLAGDTQETLRLWRTAVDAGLRLPPASRERTSFAQVAHDLLSLLERQGQRVQAEELRRYVAGSEEAREEEPGDDEPVASAAEAPAEQANTTLALPIRMPRKVLPFVKGPVDPDWLEALVRAAEAERRAQAEAVPTEADNLTRPILVFTLPAAALPFDAAGSELTNATQVLRIPPREKALPFTPGAVSAALFRAPPDDTLDDTLDEEDTGDA
jgi:tetratricopeptide (TPR) repeat protein